MVRTLQAIYAMLETPFPRLANALGDVDCLLIRRVPTAGLPRATPACIAHLLLCSSRPDIIEARNLLQYKVGEFVRRAATVGVSARSLRQQPTLSSRQTHSACLVPRRR